MQSGGTSRQVKAKLRNTAGDSHSVLYILCYYLCLELVRVRLLGRIRPDSWCRLHWRRLAEDGLEQNGRERHVRSWAAAVGYGCWQPSCVQYDGWHGRHEPEANEQVSPTKIFFLLFCIFLLNFLFRQMKKMMKQFNTMMEQMAGGDQNQMMQMMMMMGGMDPGSMDPNAAGGTNPPPPPEESSGSGSPRCLH